MNTQLPFTVPIWLLGHVIDGPVVSLTVTVKVQLAVLLDPSVAVSVITVLPIPTFVPATGD